MTKKLPNVDLFSSAGGLSLGFKNADIEVLVANHEAESAAKTYRHNFPETPFLKEDITKINAEDLIEKGRVIHVPSFASRNSA
jgi:DNA (cytosine-5)-methyltransferase 1